MNREKYLKNLIEANMGMLELFLNISSFHTQL